MNKTNIRGFLAWFRNAFSSTVTWLLILIMACSWAGGMDQISVAMLAKMMLLAAGGVLLFHVFFVSRFSCRRSFAARLSWFMVLFSALETGCFMWIGLFSGPDAAAQWLIFLGIILGMYLISLLIFLAWRRRQTPAYTEALYEYQAKMAAEKDPADRSR